MTAAKLIAEARANIPLAGPPTFANVQRRLRRLLEALLLGNDYDGNPDGGPAHLCRMIAVILAEVEELQRQPLRAVRTN